MRAAANGQARSVELLIAAGAEVNARRADGMTALIRAAFSGHLEIVTTLLQSGADVYPTDRLGMTAHDWALAKGHDEVATILAGGGVPALDLTHTATATREIHSPVENAFKDFEPISTLHEEAGAISAPDYTRVEQGLLREKNRFHLTLLEGSSKRWRVTRAALILITSALAMLFILHCR
jgi:ankyrin repeat protein